MASGDTVTGKIPSLTPKKYCANALGSVHPHTKGLYSPSLKQLLVRNLSDQQDMLETVRHEGFHQYLDRFLDNPPVWFNEGMAEYYELGEERGRTLRLGQVDMNHVATLRSRCVCWRGQCALTKIASTISQTSYVG